MASRERWEILRGHTFLLWLEARSWIKAGIHELVNIESVRGLQCEQAPKLLKHDSNTNHLIRTVAQLSEPTAVSISGAE
jgi:hypothetical protein